LCGFCSQPCCLAPSPFINTHVLSIRLPEVLLVMKFSSALSLALALVPALQVSATPFAQKGKSAAPKKVQAAAGADQTSLTLDSSVICQGCQSDGQNPPVTGQVASLKSVNNFINFCATVPQVNITNGLQVQAGSCNPVPMGLIPSVANMPSSKFVFPKNGGTVQANQAFTVQLAIKNMQTGLFTNAQKTYFAAPQQLNNAGQIAGHSHVTIEQITTLDQTTTTDPTKFAFFKGFDDAAVGGILTTNVTSGLPGGVYRMCSIATAANHQPVLVPIAQHGFLDDCVYFTSSGGGAATPASSAPPAASSSASPKVAVGSQPGKQGGNQGKQGGNQGKQGGNQGKQGGNQKGKHHGHKGRRQYD